MSVGPYEAVYREIEQMSQEDLQSAGRGTREHLPGPGRHLRPCGRGAPVPARHRAPRGQRRRLGHHRAGRGPARPRHRGLPRRCLRIAALRGRQRRAAQPHHLLGALPPSRRRHPSARWRPRPRQRHRPGARSARHPSRARGQRARALGCQLRALEPAGHVADVLRALRDDGHPARCWSIPSGSGPRSPRSRPRVSRSPPSWCSRRASTTRPTTSTRCWREPWAWSSSRVETSRSSAGACTCAPPPDGSAWTSSTAAWMTTTSIRSTSGPTRPWARPGS